MSVNTLYAPLRCPHCQASIDSGVGFKAGALKNRNYRLEDKIDWDGASSRPAEKPKNGNLKTVGYFNCDNPKCTSWRDCYPEVQLALIEVEKNVIKKVSIYEGQTPTEEFAILD